MRTYDDVATTERCRAAAAQFPQPPPNKREFGFRDKARRADVEKRRLRGVQAKGHMELLASHRGTKRKERVEPRGADNRDTLTRKTVQRFCLIPLLLVPDEHPVRPPVQSAFRTQVVPAIEQHPG